MFFVFVYEYFDCLYIFVKVCVYICVFVPALPFVILLSSDHAISASLDAQSSQSATSKICIEIIADLQWSHGENLYWWDCPIAWESSIKAALLPFLSQCPEHQQPFNDANVSGMWGGGRIQVPLKIEVEILITYANANTDYTCKYKYWLHMQMQIHSSISKKGICLQSDLVWC